MSESKKKVVKKHTSKATTKNTTKKTSPKKTTVKKTTTRKTTPKKTTKPSSKKTRGRRKRKLFTGFTLIELLATITIVGILSMTAAPAVSSTIDNSRKSAYANVALRYIEAIRQAATQDELRCGSSSFSSMPSDSYYYVRFDSTKKSGQDLMESGGKSPYGNGDVKGVVMIYKGPDGNKYSIAIVDAEGRGFGNYQGYGYTIHSFVSEEKVKKENYMRKTVYGHYYFQDFDAHETAQFPSGYFCIDQNFRCPDEYHISNVSECKLK